MPNHSAMRPGMRPDGTALYLFAIVFFWTPPHFWALSLLMKNEYEKVGVPMLPVVRGEAETRRQILLYSVLLYAVTQLPFCAGGFGGLARWVGGGGDGLWMRALRMSSGRCRPHDCWGQAGPGTMRP